MIDEKKIDLDLGVAFGGDRSTHDFWWPRLEYRGGGSFAVRRVGRHFILEPVWLWRRHPLFGVRKVSKHIKTF